MSQQTLPHPPWGPSLGGFKNSYFPWQKATNFWYVKHLTYQNPLLSSPSQISSPSLIIYALREVSY